VFVVNLKCCLNIFVIFLGKIDFVIFLEGNFFLNIYIYMPRDKVAAVNCGHVYRNTRV
jgi:hypothetical protein